MTTRRSVPYTLRLFLLVALVFNGIALACEAVSCYVLHLDAPYSTPLLTERPVPDLENFAEPFRHLHTPAFFQQTAHYMYPAPVAPLYGFFFSLPQSENVFQTTLYVLLAGSALLFGVRLRRTGVGVGQCWLVGGGAALLSYPAMFELKQGNMELFVCLLVGVGIWCFVRGHLHTAAICIGIAGAMKIFPLAYLGLFVARKAYRPIVTALVAATVVTVGTLLYLTPSVSTSWHGVGAGLEYYQRTVALRIQPEIGFDHSLLGIVKRLMESHFDTPEHAAPVLRVYLLVAAATGVLLFFLRIRRMPFLNQVLSLCVASILLTPVSFDYTLLHLYVPWGLLVFFAFGEDGRVTTGLTAIFVCLALATSIETELIYGGDSYGGQFKAVVLVALLALSLMFPLFPSQEISDMPQALAVQHF